MKLAKGNFSLTVLEWFVAPRLADLKSCGAPEIAPLQDAISRLMIEGVFGNLPARNDAQRTAIVQICRRASEAISAYLEGRNALLDFVNSEVKAQNLQSHAKAVQHFEACISSAYLALNMLVRHFSAMGIPIPDVSSVTPNKITYDRGKEFDRLRLVHNRVKHFDEDVDDALTSGSTPPASPIWFTDTGIESSNGAISFNELGAILEDLRAMTSMFSETLPAKIRAHLAATSRP